MENIQTICPTCQTKYFVSMMHLSVAEGTVCCGQCHSTFNAYYHMPSKHFPPQSENHTEYTFKLAKYSALEIFHTQNSANTNLLAHLNHTQHSQVSSNALPESVISLAKKRFPPWVSLTLFILSSLLIVALFFNIIRYNTNILSKFPFAASLSNNCVKTACLSNTRELIHVQVSKIEETYPYTTTVTGSIQNLNPNTELLPKLILTVNLTKTRTQSFSFSPEMYLPYYFKNKTELIQNQKIDFRLDVPFSYHSIHSIQLKTADTPP